MTYRPFEKEEDQKLASTTITRILPRMQRLKGPYGMYGTVYGISTPVVHVAHHVPAKAILNGLTPFASESTNKNKKQSNNSPRRRQCRSSVPIIQLTGASKAPAYNHFKNFCGDGVFTADGEDWKEKRATVLHTLLKGTELATRLEQEANHAADVFVDQIEALPKSKGDNNGNDVDENDDVLVPNIVPLLQRSTIGLIYRYITHSDPDWEPPRAMRIATGSDCSGDSAAADAEAISVASSSLDDDIDRRSESESLVVSYLKSIVRIRMIILAQSRSIWFVLPRWCYRWFSSLYRDEETTLGPIREFARRACSKAKPQSPLYKLSTSDGPYRDTSLKGIQHSTGSGVNKNLLDEAITLLFAGQDTSAATLSWILHLLSLHPDVQEKLAEEVQSVLAEAAKNDTKPHMSDDEDASSVVTKKILSKMPYLDAVIKESMRLYPVAPFIVRRVTETIDLPSEDPANNTNNNKSKIPAGSIACIWIYSLHRNPEFWHRPDDFVPERWLLTTYDDNDQDAATKDVGQTNGAYMPFASGPRNCLGQPLAHVILRTLLCKLVHRFEFIEPKLVVKIKMDKGCSNANELRKDMQAGFTVLPTGGVELLVRRRRDNSIKIKST